MSLSLLLAMGLLGLLALPHCCSMCGCVLAPRWASSQPAAFFSGRVLGYASLGALAGGLNQAGAHAALQAVPMFKALNAMLMAALAFAALVLLWRGRLPLQQGSVVQWVGAKPGSAAAQLKPSAQAAWLRGVLWIFLPCGVLYAAAALAYLSGAWWQGAVLMGWFGVLSSVHIALGNAARVWVAQRWGEATMVRTSGALVLAGLALMAARSQGWVTDPPWLQGVGLCW